MQDFNIATFINHSRDPQKEVYQQGNLRDFKQLCNDVRKEIDTLESMEAVKEDALKRQKEALLGVSHAVSYYKNKIWFSRS